MRKIDDATVVFSGRPVSHDEGTRTVRCSADPVPWTFAVDRVDKGTLTPQRVVLTARENLVASSGDPVTATFCGGTQELTGVPADLPVRHRRAS
ncbi:MAG: hypothetical protein J0I49_01730 [Pseudonocardia sp.]|uniref:hypothetical protein n=1 Tax=Pseudonocardia sp. TaxID=60912 RepID=UPI001AD3ED3A|nr:hypothetical protein [Pseudonocardia sp.]MBN9096828.1 hypothetical protein [Pseudonocardia sp.]